MATQTGKSLRKLRTSMTPRVWRDWLDGDEARAQLGADTCAAEALKADARNARRKAEILNDGPGGNWHELAIDGVAFPPDNQSDGRRHAVRMIRSMVSGRLTPPQCLVLEDQMDAMSANRAFDYRSPDGPSPSAAIIERIAATRAKPIGGEW